MANKKVDKKKVRIYKFIAILVLGIVLGVSCIFSKPIEKFLSIGEKQTNFASIEEFSESKLNVHYVDVGQGDSTLIFLPDNTIMLIDAGTPSSSKRLVKYIQDLGISQIDYFILTHSDSDHVGGAKKIFDSFEIKTVYRPFQISINSDGSVSSCEKLGVYATSIYKDTCNKISTAVYRDFVAAAYSETYKENNQTKNAEVWVTYDGIKIESKTSEQFTFEFFAPLVRAGATQIDFEQTQTHGYPTKYYGNATAESKNNASPVMLLEYNNKSFLFTGDANNKVEEDVIGALQLEPTNLQRISNVDVFQAGHHGSKTSNCQEFLDVTKPNYVVVSCGKDNSYGHPNEDFVTRLTTYNHEAADYLLRTDTIGTIVFGFKSDGKLAYSALKMGDGGITIYWWEIALGIFIVISIVIISVKVTSNKKATTKRAINTYKKLTK